MTWTDDDLTWTYTTLDDLEPIGGMLAKESVSEHLFFGPNTLEETQEYFSPLVEPMQDAIAKGEQPDNHLFTICRTDGRFVGQCALVAVGFGSNNYTIGYQLDDPWWRRGYGTRACEFIVWYGFDVLGARRLSGDCLGTNTGSARIMERCGFQREGVHRGYYLLDGNPRDNLLYGLLREELDLDLSELRARFQGDRP
jgi:ribosomal-protein-alanine N-acetyltransferase